MAGKNGSRPKVLDAIAMTVTFIWALAMVAQLLDPADRQVPLEVHGIMAALVSALFGVGALARRNDGG